jgi:hypothetical protein
MRLDDIRQTDGTLPAYAWPGGYPMYYLDKGGMTLCPTCANRETDPSQAPVAYGVNYEDPSLDCDDCSQRIPSAYAEDEA